MSGRLEILLADADVLIDYRDTDLTILTLVSEHIGQVRVLRAVLDEVQGLTLKACSQAGIKVVRLKTSLLSRASSLPKNLSFEDRACVVACEEYGWTCVSNDRALRRVCTEHQVRVRWGLSLMIELVACGALRESRAVQISQAIHELNPAHIGPDILRRFRAQLRVASKRPRST